MNFDGQNFCSGFRKSKLCVVTSYWEWLLNDIQSIFSLVENFISSGFELALVCVNRRGTEGFWNSVYGFPVIMLEQATRGPYGKTHRLTNTFNYPLKGHRGILQPSHCQSPRTTFTLLLVTLWGSSQVVSFSIHWRKQKTKYIG